MMRRSLHAFVLSTRAIPGFRNLYRFLYRAAAWASAWSFSRLDGIKSAVLHRGLSGSNWEPGVSDIDLILLCDEQSQWRPDFLSRLQQRLETLRSIAPMLGDLWIGTRREIACYLEWGGQRAWEDYPRWRLLAGEPVQSQTIKESSIKRRRLDPWVWAFISHMEISRRYFRGNPNDAGKSLQDMRKLYCDFRRYADFTIAAENAPLVDRPETRRRLDGLNSMSARDLWLESAQCLSRCSSALWGLLPTGPKTVIHLPPPDPNMNALTGRTIVIDKPYHTYALLESNSTSAAYTRAAEALMNSSIPGVPIVLEPETWALLLQSSYLGAPLGWLNGREYSPSPSRGLFSDYGTQAEGHDLVSIRLLPQDLRQEIAAEAASWMGLWWRYLWIAPGWPNRFVLFHLYTRAIGLRLTLSGFETGPWSDVFGLIARSREAWPHEREYWNGLELFFQQEDTRCIDECPRRALAAEHVEGLSAIIGTFSDLIEQRQEAFCALHQ